MSPLSSVAAICAAFTFMVSIGTSYGVAPITSELSLQHNLPISLPFASFSAGLAFGTLIASRLYYSIPTGLMSFIGCTAWTSTLWQTGTYLDATTNLSQTSCIFIYAIGGFGVGLTYLATIVALSERYPDRPAFPSIIGPMGFSTGSCIILLGVPEPAISTFTRFTGGAIVVFSGLAALYSPSATIHPALSKTAGHPRYRKLTISAILFANAFPGMCILPYLHQIQSLVSHPFTVAASFVFLMAGGILARHIRLFFGTKATFLGLFAIRALLIAFMYRPTSGIRSLAMLSVLLFAHGVGFGIIPGLLRNPNDLRPFAKDYGQVLVGWGASGVAGFALAHDLRSAFQVSGTVAVVGALAALLIRWP